MSENKRVKRTIAQQSNNLFYNKNKKKESNDRRYTPTVYCQTIAIRENNCESLNEKFQPEFSRTKSYCKFKKKKQTKKQNNCKFNQFISFYKHFCEKLSEAGIRIKISYINKLYNNMYIIQIFIFSLIILFFQIIILSLISYITCRFHIILKFID